MKNLITLLFLLFSMSTMAQSFKGNTFFNKDQKYYSADKRYFFQIQSDGNFVLYKVINSRKFIALWHTHTNGKAIKTCVFQTDGNLVLYDYTGKAQWDAWTDQKNKDNNGLLKRFSTGGGNKFYPQNNNHLVMQNDGNLVIYSNNGTPRWHTDTYEKN